MIQKLIDFLKKASAPGFEQAKAEILAKLDWGIQAIPGVGVPRVVATLKRDIAGIVAKAHLPGMAAALVSYALASVDWEGLMGKPADRAIAELKRIRKQVEGARL